MQHPDEGTIHAWLDGALSPEEAASIESHVAECGECSAMAAEARGLIAASSRIVSALDVIPGGVIPARKPLRAVWYMNTQLRAAAAVIVVAGASLLVLRNGRQEAAMQASQPMLAAAPSAAPVVSAEKPAEADKAIAQRAAPIVPKTKKIAPTPETGARRENSQKQVIADEVATIAPPPSASVAAASEIRSDAARVGGQQRALFGKVSGVAVTSTATPGLPELRQVRADTTAAAQVAVYEVSPGIEVTLFESSATTPAVDALSAKAPERKVAQKTAAPLAANAPRDVTVNSISWTSKRGKVMTLTGSLSKEKLQELRLRLPAEKQ